MTLTDRNVVRGSSNSLSIFIITFFSLALYPDSLPRTLTSKKNILYEYSCVFTRFAYLALRRKRMCMYGLQRNITRTAYLLGLCFVGREEPKVVINIIRSAFMFCLILLIK